MAERDLERVSHYVRSRRGELGMTQEELAKAAGVDTKTIYNVESGTHLPYAKNASRIESALGWRSGTLVLIAQGSLPVINGDGGQELTEDPGVEFFRRAIRAQEDEKSGRARNGGHRSA